MYLIRLAGATLTISMRTTKEQFGANVVSKRSSEQPRKLAQIKAGSSGAVPITLEPSAASSNGLTTTKKVRPKIHTLAPAHPGEGVAVVAAGQEVLPEARGKEGEAHLVVSRRHEGPRPG